jgi:hypothetical protein
MWRSSGGLCQEEHEIGFPIERERAGLMSRMNARARVQSTSATAPGEEERPLRSVVLQHTDHCFLDTDGVTRDAARMLEIMGRWRPHCSDGEAGVRRNSAFNPDLRVVVSSDLRISYPRGDEPSGDRSLLFTIVPRDRA